MEQINLDASQTVSTPVRRDEVYVPFKKFVLASDFSIPSYNPDFGGPGFDRSPVTSPNVLYWVVKYDGDPNGYIGLGPGYITLNFEGVYLIMCRVTLRRDTVGNTQRVVFMRLDLDSEGYFLGADPLNGYYPLGDGDTQNLTVNGSASTSLLLDESSLGAGDSGGTSLLTQCVLPVVQFTALAPPRYVATFFAQQSDSLQPQNLTPRDQDNWLQVAYLGRVDTLESNTFRYLD